MPFAASLKSGALCAAILAFAFCVRAQEPAALPKPEGIPPRAAPTDYEFHAKAGKLTIAAEFTGHAVGTPEGTLTTDDFVVVEAAVYGPPGMRANLSFGDFSLRINGKKTPSPGEPYGLVVKNLKDPNMVPPASEKSATSLTSGSQAGGGAIGQTDTSPPPVKIPLEVRRNWEQRLQKASLPEGDRLLPQAGLLFFRYHGKEEKIQSIELIYSSEEGQTTFSLQP